VATDLAEAAKEGDVDKVQALLGEGAEADGSDDWGATALHLAVKGGHTEVETAYFLFGVACIHAASARPGPCPGNAALTWPELDPPRQAAKALLQAGANVQLASASDDETSPLHYAAGVGDAEMVALLLAHGAQAGMRDEFDDTPHDIAVRAKHAAAAALLAPGAKAAQLADEAFERQQVSLLPLRPASRRRGGPRAARQPARAPRVNRPHPRPPASAGSHCAPPRAAARRRSARRTRTLRGTFPARPSTAALICRRCRAPLPAPQREGGSIP
jgi:hypothetical protein